MKITKRLLTKMIREELIRESWDESDAEEEYERMAPPQGSYPAHADPDENRQLVTDYLLNLPENELIQIAAEYLGEDAVGLNYDYALQWVEGMSLGEIEDIAQEMGVE